ncbi:MAG: glycosyltransferase family 4 protein [Thermotogae bacterium]|nr:glycosyltransferase family 4 protein [Thermotogota bacterium]
MFNALSDRLGGRVKFFFYAKEVEKRKGWEQVLGGARFRYEILKSSVRRLYFGGDENYVFLPTGIPELVKFRKIVVSGGLGPFELFLSLKAQSLGVPYVVWSGAPSLLLGGWWGVPYRIPLRFFIFSGAETVVAATSMAAKHSKRLGAKKVVIAHTTFDMSRFWYEREHTSSTPKLLFVGRLIPRKRVEDLFRAMAGSDLSLTIVGDGPHRSYLEASSERLGLGKQVSFRGWVPYEDLKEIYRKHDILVLPARWEVFGFVVVEAAASGVVPVVSSEVGAKDLLPERLVFPIGNAEAMRRILFELKDPNLRNRILESVKVRLRDATPQSWAKTFAEALEKS